MSLNLNLISNSKCIAWCAVDRTCENYSGIVYFNIKKRDRLSFVIKLRGQKCRIMATDQIAYNYNNYPYLSFSHQLGRLLSIDCLLI
jgi:hypothetical protein